MDLILDLTASRLCYLISREVEEIAPHRFRKGETTYKQIIELALLNTYNELCLSLENDDKDLNLIYSPNQLKGVRNSIKYRDDLTQPNKQRQRIETMEEFY